MRRFLFIFVLIFSLQNPMVAAQSMLSKRLAQLESNAISAPEQVRIKAISEQEKFVGASQPLALQLRYQLLRANLALTLGLSEEAQFHALSGLSILGDNSAYRMQLAFLWIKSLVQVGQHNQAIAAIDKLLMSNDNASQEAYHAQLLMHKAKSYLVIKRKDLSLLALKASYQLAQTSGNEELLQKVSIVLAGQLLELNDFNQAENLLKQSDKYYIKNQVSVENLIVQIKLSDLAYSRGDHADALTILIKAKKLAEQVNSGLFRFVLTLRIAELQLEADQIVAVGVSLNSLDFLQRFARRSDDKDRLLLVQARYKVARNDFSGLNTLLQSYGSLELNGLSKNDGRVLDLLKLKAQGLASQGLFEAAYNIMEQHQLDYNTHSQRRNSDSLQRQKLMFDLELLEQENRNLNWNNVLQQSELKRHDQTLSQLNMLLLIIGLVAGAAIALAILLYRKRQQFYQLSYQDPLTGIHNRRYLSLVFKELQRKYLKNNQALTALMLDLDHFKLVNDRYGHGVGDEVIVAFAQCCQQVLPDNAVLIRLGGEEVLALLPQWECLEGTTIADTLRIAISQLEMSTTDGEKFNFTVSVGVASLSKTVTDKEGLLHLADQRLYIAKAEGRNRVIGFSKPKKSTDRIVDNGIIL